MTELEWFLKRRDNLSLAENKTQYNKQTKQNKANPISTAKNIPRNKIE